MALLRRWQTHLHWVSSLEALTPAADSRLGLGWWAKNTARPPRSQMSRTVEPVLFEQVVNRLEALEDGDALVAELEQAASSILARASGFWSAIARVKVPWVALGDLARAASVLSQNRGVEAGWRSAGDAVAWYRCGGWQVDAEGDGLFVENHEISAALQRLRVRLRRAYLRGVDRIGRRFSELLAAGSADVLALPTAGELALAEVERRTGPMALIFLDACRYELGCRLAELLNTGEPQRRAEVATAVAPLPSITALGMAFALPMRLCSELGASRLIPDSPLPPGDVFSTVAAKLSSTRSTDAKSPSSKSPATRFGPLPPTQNCPKPTGRSTNSGV